MSAPGVGGGFLLVPVFSLALQNKPQEAANTQLHPARLPACQLAHLHVDCSYFLSKGSVRQWGVSNLNSRDVATFCFLLLRTLPNSCTFCCRLLYNSTCVYMSRLGKRGCTVHPAVVTQGVRGQLDRRIDESALDELLAPCFRLESCPGELVGTFMQAPIRICMPQQDLRRRTYMVFGQAMPSLSRRRAVRPPGLGCFCTT
jgi:hypothetical protein